MQKITVTDEEEKIFLLIKKKSLDFKALKRFVDLFCVLLENDIFNCKGGEKILRFDGDGNLRQVETHQINWRK